MSVPASDVFVEPGAIDRDFRGALEEFRENGFARIGKVLSDEGAKLLGERADDIMLGRVAYDGMFFQKDNESGRYEELHFGRGYEGPSLTYRKIEKLEKDPLYLAFMRNAVFERVARSLIDEARIVLYRAILMTKHAGGGSNLPWHQDAGKFWGVSRDPDLQIWTALDDAPVTSGCVEFVPGSHRGGLVTPLGGVVPANRFDVAETDAKAVAVPVARGESVLIHNYVWHRSGRNSTGVPRRGFSICLMPGSTKCLRKKGAPREFYPIFEE